jgi:dihydrofolate synthase / folylpolyglutamate synthase
MFNQLSDAIHWIETRIKFRPKSDLIRMERAYQMLGIDLSKIKKIHIAGTNGKGSVASYLSHILIEAGYKVGTYTSPYLVRFNERLRVQFEEISDHDLLELIEIIYQFNETFEKTFAEPLAFFELLTLMSFLYFKKMNVDVMVMEVGLGGLLDATNVLNYDLSLITSIGFDHMKQLGNTLESIAFNKLGILKPGNHLITTVDPILHDYFRSYLKESGNSYEFLTLKDIQIQSDLPVSFMYQNDLYTSGLIGKYQFLNALISIRAIKYLYPNVPTQTTQKGLKKTSWAGRLEEISPQVYIDGAHNTHALEALKDSAETTFKDYKIIVLFSALGDKDIPGMLKIIETFSQQIYVTTFLDSRFVDLKPMLSSNHHYIEDPLLAIQTIKNQLKPNEILLMTGSLHFVGFIKKLKF